MKINTYREKEQTFLKHFILKNYLEKLAYIIGYSWNKKVCFVDCFAGPWQAEKNYENCSIKISLNVLNKVKRGLKNDHNKTVKFKAIFNEKNESAYNELENIISKENNIETVAIKGKFENNVNEILKHTDDSFALFFIDPTGWTGFGLQNIKPIIKRDNSELLINFMYDYIQRFIEADNQRKNFNKLFGNSEWRNKIDLESNDKEKLILNYYKKRIKQIGNWKYVTNTQILYPEVDRTIFYLIYTTRHIKGLLTYKKIDNKLFAEQNRVRNKTKQKGQRSLFNPNDPSEKFYYNIYRKQIKKLYKILKKLIKNKKRIEYNEILKKVLEIEMIFEKDIKDVILRYMDNNLIYIENWNSRRRRPKKGDIIVWKSNSGGD